MNGCWADVHTAVWKHWLSERGGHIDSLGLLECVRSMCPRLGHSPENKQQEREGDNKNLCLCKVPESAVSGWSSTWSGGQEAMRPGGPQVKLFRRVSSSSKLFHVFNWCFLNCFFMCLEIFLSSVYFGRWFHWFTLTDFEMFPLFFWNMAVWVPQWCLIHSGCSFCKFIYNC